MLPTVLGTIVSGGAATRPRRTKRGARADPVQSRRLDAIEGKQICVRAEVELPKFERTPSVDVTNRKKAMVQAALERAQERVPDPISPTNKKAHTRLKARIYPMNAYTEIHPVSKAANPHPTTSLVYGSPFELIAVILWPRLPIKSVNLATKKLFPKATKIGTGEWAAGVHGPTLTLLIQNHGERFLARRNWNGCPGGPEDRKRVAEYGVRPNRPSPHSRYPGLHPAGIAREKTAPRWSRNS